jgi:hypothetical protein
MLEHVLNGMGHLVLLLLVGAGVFLTMWPRPKASRSRRRPSAAKHTHTPRRARIRRRVLHLLAYLLVVAGALCGLSAALHDQRPAAEPPQPKHDEPQAEKLVPD